MKNLILVLLFTLSAGSLVAQDAKFIKAVEKNMLLMDSAKSAADYTSLSNNFERIAKAEKDKWEPYYYASLCQVIASFMDTVKAKRDAYLEKAEGMIALADSLKPENSEIYTMKGFIGQARMTIDPMQRWQKYGAAATANLKKAKELDPSNPRPDYLIGQSLLYTPESFGGGKVPAMAVLEQSLAKYKEFKPVNSISPVWGQKQVEAILDKIKEK